MAEKRRRGRPPSNKQRALNLVNDHRVNDLIFGHTGRVTYLLSEYDEKQDDHGVGQSIGSLRLSRHRGPQHSFTQMFPMERWMSPTMSAGHKEPGQALPHLAWLLKNAPEALSGMAGPSIQLATDLIVSQPSKQRLARLPLLAYGEIIRQAEGRIVSVSVLAMAVGESGHILRISRLHDQTCRWGVWKDISLQTVLDDSSEEGHWCGDGLPISQVKFTLSGRTDAPTRWLLVQTSRTTTVFAPVVHRIAVEATKPHCGYRGHGSNLISMNPLFQITAEDTGGFSHCDVAFNPSSGKEPPQLAIIDKGGNWFLWDLIGITRSRKVKPIPILKVRGHFMDEIPLSPSLSGASGLGGLHRISWLVAPREEANLLSTDETEDVSGKSSVLMLCNGSSLRLRHTGTNEWLRTLNLTRHNGLDALLDIHPCPTKPTRVLILTTTALFWLDLDRLVSGDNKPGDPASTPKSSHPCVLLSCPHLLDPSDKSLKMSVALAPMSWDRRVCLVAVYSMMHESAKVFWLAEPVFGGQATFQQQTIRFTLPSEEPDQIRPDFRGHQTMVLLRRPLELNKNARILEDSPGNRYIDCGVRFFQALSLGADLELRSTICVTAPQSSEEVIMPVPLEDTRRLELQRKAVLGYVGNGFVVPDHFDERTVLQHLPNQLNTDQLSEVRLPISGPRTKQYSTFNLSAVFKILSDNIARVADTTIQNTDTNWESQIPSPVDVIRRIIDVGLEHGSFPFTTVLNAADDDFVAEFGPDSTLLSWPKQLAEIDFDALEEGRINVFDYLKLAQINNYGRAESLYESMEDLCIVERIPGCTRNVRAALFAKRQGLVGHAAVQLFLSQISASVTPQKLLSLHEETPGLDGGISTPRSRHVTPSDAGSRFRMSSSPPRASSWLRQGSLQAQTGDTSQRSTPLLGSGEDLDGANNEGNADGGPAGMRGDMAGGVEEDVTIARLRQYAVSIKTETPWQGGDLRLLSHWQLGSDPGQFSWRPVGAGGEADEEKQQREKEARERRRLRNEKKAQREQELQLMRGDNVSRLSSPVPPRIQHSSQQVPPEFGMRSSQVRPSQIMPSQIMSSQVMPSQARPGQIMSSQVVSSLRPSQIMSSQAMHSSQPFGSGPRKKKQKKKARGFK